MGKVHAAPLIDRHEVPHGCVADSIALQSHAMLQSSFLVQNPYDEGDDSDPKKDSTTVAAVTTAQPKLPMVCTQRTDDKTTCMVDYTNHTIEQNVEQS